MGWPVVTVTMETEKWEALQAVAAERDLLALQVKGLIEDYDNACIERDNWQETARFHCRNEFYWRFRAKAAEARLSADVEREAYGEAVTQYNLWMGGVLDNEAIDTAPDAEKTA